MLATLAALLLAALPSTAFASTPAPAAAAAPAAVTAPSAVPGESSGLPVRALSSLPAQATDTYRLIQRGGPFPYSRDGITFQNREGILPARSGGYYREYTVPTPGSSDRGARRIVTGSADEVYYTGDHYSSFVVVDVSR
ncbi:ribonuclease domain-containing protein [Pseudonocardia sediminis]|uniref:ribonuclease domain-containing protein n=1 Tax=Pseudonocardia sediminis TaxID=1397368 RepID=UPI003BF81335